MGLLKLYTGLYNTVPQLIHKILMDLIHKKTKCITIPCRVFWGLVHQIPLASKRFIFFPPYLHVPSSFFGLEGSQLHWSAVLIQVFSMLAVFLQYNYTSWWVAIWKLLYETHLSALEHRSRTIGYPNLAIVATAPSGMPSGSWTWGVAITCHRSLQGHKMVGMVLHFSCADIMP